MWKLGIGLLIFVFVGCIIDGLFAKPKYGYLLDAYYLRSDSCMYILKVGDDTVQQIAKCNCGYGYMDTIYLNNSK